MSRPALIALLALVAVSLWAAGLPELAEDEAYYWVWSRHLAAGYFDHPPAIAWLIRAGTFTLGHSERAVRAPGVLLAGASIWLAASLVRSRLLAVLLLGAMPLMWLGGLLATPDVPLLAAWALGLWAAAGRRWTLLGVAAGLAMLSKYTGVLLLPLVLLANPRDWRGALRAGLVALLVYSPNALWNLRHDGISWLFQLHHAAAGGDRLGWFAAQAGLAGPLLFLAALVWWAVAWRGERLDRLLWWTSFPLLLVALLAGGEANWAAPAWIGPALGLARRGGRWGRAGWLASGVNLGLSGLFLLHLAHPLVDLPADPLDRLVGGRALGESVAAWGQPHVWTSRYQEAALIEFYGGIPARTWPGLGRPDQYDLWAGPPPDAGLFVRPWRGDAPLVLDQQGYEQHGGNVVSAYADSTDPRVPRLVGRWQVYDFRRSE